jgi:hypothetical protein
VNSRPTFCNRGADSEVGKLLAERGPERSRIVKEIKVGDHVVIHPTKTGDHLTAARSEDRRDENEGDDVVWTPNLRH